MELRTYQRAQPHASDTPSSTGERKKWPLEGAAGSDGVPEAQVQLSDYFKMYPPRLPDTQTTVPAMEPEFLLAPRALSDEEAYNNWPYALYDENILLLGILHRSAEAVKRVEWAITRYQPDIAAVEASPLAVGQRHPSSHWRNAPPEHELEVAVTAAAHFEWLSISALDPHSTKRAGELGQTDVEIFSDWGLLEDGETLTHSLYRDLTLNQLREWRRETRQREPELYREVLSKRDDTMAGHLHALRTSKEQPTIVAAVGLQHLTGVLDRLRNPERLPEEAIEMPSVTEFNIW